MSKINCFKCRYFKTTWNPNFPRACKAYGFKTKEIPSAYILKVSGSPCMEYSPISTTKDQPKVKQRHSNIDVTL